MVRVENVQELGERFSSVGPNHEAVIKVAFVDKGSVWGFVEY